MLEHYLALAKPLLDQYGYWAVFVSILVEGFGIPAPGQTLMLAAAILAGRGELHIAAVLAIAWSAAVLGDNLGYALGRWGGRRLLLRIPFMERHLTAVERFFQHYGGGMVIGARFVEGLRQLNGLVAGSMGMAWWRFLSFNAIGAALWVGVWAGGVYVLGEHFSVVEHWLRYLNPAHWW